MKKALKIVSVIILCLALLLPTFCAEAKMTGVSISGARSPSAGRSYTYSATVYTSHGTSLSSVEWFLQGGLSGASISGHGRSATLRLTSGARGSGSVCCVAIGNDGTRSSREFAINIQAKPTTKRHTTTKRHATTKRHTTTKKHTTTKRRTTTRKKHTTTKRRVTTTKPRITTRRHSTTHAFPPGPIEPSTTRPTTKPEITGEDIPEEEQKPTDSATEQSTQAESTTTSTDDTSFTVEAYPKDDQTVTFKCSSTDADGFNLYLCPDRGSTKDYVLIYSGDTETYTANKLEPGKKYKVVAEAFNNVNGQIVTEYRTKEIEFSVQKLSFWQKLSALFT